MKAYKFYDCCDKEIWIKMTKVEDTRCPLNVSCPWQGSAFIWIKVNNDPTEVKLEMGVPYNYTGNSDYGFTLKLITLTPYPLPGVTVNPADYIAIIKIN